MEWLLEKLELVGLTRGDLDYTASPLGVVDCGHPNKTKKTGFIEGRPK
jgi:hypothetical protein